MNKVLRVAGLLLLGFQNCSLAANVPEPWKPFQFLIGDWVGSGSGKPGQGSGEFSVKLDLNNKVLIRRNRNQLAPPASQTAGAVHEDLMIIYQLPASSQFRADYFDSEGPVIRCTISFSEHAAVFESEEAGNATRFKLNYERKPEGLLGIQFAIAAPESHSKPTSAAPPNESRAVCTPQRAWQFLTPVPGPPGLGVRQSWRLE